MSTSLESYEEVDKLSQKESSQTVTFAVTCTHLLLDALLQILLLLTEYGRGICRPNFPTCESSLLIAYRYSVLSFFFQILDTVINRTRKTWVHVRTLLNNRIDALVYHANRCTRLYCVISWRMRQLRQLIVWFLHWLFQTNLNVWLSYKEKRKESYKVLLHKMQ